jgi:GntR family transcriptional regulator / MocR family aminotransferase
MVFGRSSLTSRRIPGCQALVMVARDASMISSLSSSTVSGMVSGIITRCTSRILIWGARNVLRAAGLVTMPIATDDAGMAPTALDWETPPRLIYVSPSSQYPTGSVLSLEPRLALLAAADEAGAWIIEDDYDNEQRYDNRAVASLFGLARKQRVIYLGTFSKVMFPGLQLSYMVLPEDLTNVFQIGNAELYRGGRLIEQAVLADFMAEGYFTTHIKRMRQVYRGRCDVLCAEMERRHGGAVSPSGGHAGLQLLYHFNCPIDDTMVASLALTRGLVVRPLSMYYQEKANVRQGMNLGYGGVPVERIESAMPILAQAIEEQFRASRGRGLASSGRVATS